MPCVHSIREEQVRLNEQPFQNHFRTTASFLIDEIVLMDSEVV